MKNMPDFVRYIAFLLLIFICLLPLSQQANPEKQAQHSERHFREEKLEEYRQDRAFRYDVNPYRRNTIWQKVHYYLVQLFKAIFSDKGATPYLVSLILLGIITFVVIKLSDGQFQWIFGKESKNKAGQVVLPDEKTGGTDFIALADKALQEGDLRMCVRYRYLCILKELDEIAFIHWHKDKTNRDYLREIQDPAIRSQFQVQTLVFDYVWYGKFPLSNDQFQSIQSDFQRLIESIQNAKKKPDEG
jgi:hypothetical protein